MPEPLRFCHCGGDPCPHAVHVHVQMPGLQKEDDLGRLFPLAGFASKARRSVENVAVAGKSGSFRRALRQLMGSVTGTEPWTSAVPRRRCSGAAGCS